MRATIILACLLSVVSCNSQVMGFTQFNDGGVHDIDYDVKDEVWVDWDSPGMGTTVNWLDGADTGGHEFHTYEDSYLNIFSGSIDDLFTYDNSQVSTLDGEIEWVFTYGNSQVSMSGGWIGWVFTYGNSQVSMSGGSIISDLHVVDNGVLTIQGSGFAVDSVPAGYGELTSILGGDYPDEPARRLTGTLASGDPIDNDFYIGHTAQIVLAPPPGIFTLTMAVEPNGIGIDTVTPSIGDANYASLVSLNATQFIHCPDIYQFDHWVGDVTDANLADTTVFMDSDKTVTAVFVATRECGDECHPDDYFGDYNHDCIINVEDFAEFAFNWLVCTKPDCD